MARGRSNSALCAELHLSGKTIEAHVRCRDGGLGLDRRVGRGADDAACVRLVFALAFEPRPPADPSVPGSSGQLRIEGSTVFVPTVRKVNFR